MRYRALINKPHRKYLTGYGLRAKRREKYLYVRQCNNITKKENSGK